MMMTIEIAWAFSSSVTIDNSRWNKIGQGTYTALFFAVYDIALYAQNERYNAAMPHMLAIRYHQAFDADDIIARSLKEMSQQHRLSRQQQDVFRAHLVRAIPSVKKHDIIRAIYTPKIGIKFQHNQQPPVAINDPVFAARFFDIWLGKKTSDANLRRALLQP